MNLDQIDVLLVEDNPDDAELLAETLFELEDIEIRLFPVSTLVQAREYLAANTCDLVMLDLSLPDSHGLDTLTALLNDVTHVPIVIMTGLDDQEVAFKACDLGASDYVVKGTYTPGSLARTVRFVVKQARDEADLRARQANLERIIRERTQDLVNKNIELETEIAERVSAEKEQRLLAQVVENAEDAVVVTDAYSNIEYVNDAFVRATGYTRDEVMGKNPRLLNSGEHSPEFFREMYRVITSGQAWRGRLRNRRKDGAICTFDSVITSTKTEQGIIEKYVMVSRDVTQLLELQSQLERSQRLEAIGQLAGGIAHDFNNVLQAIMGYGSFLLERTKSDEVSLEYASGIQDAAARAAHLTRQLLAFGRRQVLRTEIIHINDVIQSTTKMIERLIGENIRLAIELDPSIDSVNVDVAQIEQIVVNLCVNARDAIGGIGEIRIATNQIAIDHAFCVENPWASPGEFVVLTVADNGAGMSEDVKSRIFEPFFTTKEEGRGSGLGLATVYGIVNQLGGFVHCDSTPGEGTVFRLYFPVARDDGERTKKEESSSPSEAIAAGAHGSERILVAEDDKAVANLLQRLLEGAGYDVVVTSNGEEARRAILNASEPFALVISDVVMPEMGGVELGYAVRDMELKGQKPKFLFCSGYSSSFVGGEMFDDLTYEYLEKPYTPARLLLTVRTLLDVH